MPKRKAKTTNSTGQTGDVKNAKCTPAGSKPGLKPMRVTRNHRYVEKENVSSVKDTVKAVDLGSKVESDNPPARRALRNCALKNAGLIKPVAIVKHAVGGSDEPLKDTMGVPVDGDENTTVINSFKTFCSKRTLLENVPFSSTPMVRPVSEVKNDHQISIRRKSKRQALSSGSMPSDVIFNEAHFHSNQFKVPILKCVQLKDAPYSSTPLKNLPIPSGDLPPDRMACKVLPKLVLSPIRGTRSKTNSKKPSKFMKKSVDNDDYAPCSSLQIRNTFIKEHDTLFRCKLLTKFKAQSKVKASLQEQAIKPDVDNVECFSKDKGNARFSGSVRKYTRMPEMSTEFLTSRSCSEDSNSGEYDPFTLFILHDPITMNDLPDPRTSKFRNCEMKYEEFDDLGLPFEWKKRTKMTKKPVVKSRKVDCESKVNDWLQEIQEINQEFSEIENMELCIE